MRPRGAYPERVLLFVNRRPMEGDSAGLGRRRRAVPVAHSCWRGAVAVPPSVGSELGGRVGDVGPSDLLQEQSRRKRLFADTRPRRCPR